MTNEEWLKRAVEELDVSLFRGDLNLLNHDFQIYYGRTKGKSPGEVIQPSDAEAVTLADFFPTTIGIDFELSDPERIMEVLAYECVKAFFGLSKGKPLKKKLKQYYFEGPFNEPNPSDSAKDLIREALKNTEKSCGPWPGKAVKFPTKEKKEKKPTKAIFFCPECGLEYSVPTKKLKNIQGTPTCICGTRCGRQLEESEDNEKEE